MIDAMSEWLFCEVGQRLPNEKKKVPRYQEVGCTKYIPRYLVAILLVWLHFVKL